MSGDVKRGVARSNDRSGLAMLSALFHRARTGEGQWIDASQSEVGLFIMGVACQAV